MKPIRNIFIFVLFPIWIGGLIYIVSRPKTLRMFKWFENINIDYLTNYIRNELTNFDYPYWVKYNMPDFLWVFSFTSLLLIIWNNKVVNENILYILFPVLIGVLSEFGQLFELVKGTYDILDILFYSLGSLTSIFLFRNFKTNENEKPCTAFI